MDQPPEKPQCSSRASSRRASGASPRELQPSPRELQPSPREPQPSTPPDPHEATSENIFQYPPTLKDLPAAFQSLLDFQKRQEEFYRKLNVGIAQAAKVAAKSPTTATAEPSGSPITTAAGTAESPTTTAAESARFPITTTAEPAKSPTITAGDPHKCACCQHQRQEGEQFKDPLQGRLASSTTAPCDAVEQLNRLYSLLDQFKNVENELRERKESLQHMNLMNEKVLAAKVPKASVNRYLSETEGEFQESMALLESILAKGTDASMKRGAMKQQRERSKSVMAEDILTLNRDREAQSVHVAPYLQRRQSSYCEGKSKVSKWTKVKAAFKWERANVPVLSEGQKEASIGMGLTPVNHEVARYLRVPSAPAGGSSSADSILSSSSGHILSETGSPGTISSASSMDDIDSSCRQAMRRNSSKSDSRGDSRLGSDDGDATAAWSKSGSFKDVEQLKAASRGTIPSKSSSLKSMRKSKAVPDFEVVPEDVVADIKAKSPPIRRTKPQPSPLDLNLKQDLGDSDSFVSPHLLRSPKDGSQSFSRSRKINSPGNSSVPSSPSRHSDFFAEFESEDFSSGDFSEPTSPNYFNSRNTFYQKQDEINQRYQLLRAKLDMEFEAKRREWEKTKSNPKVSRAMSLMTPPKTEEHSPNQTINSNLSAKLLEDNLTPDFKKKLRKWRVKQKVSMSLPQSQNPPTSPNKDTTVSTKIDWHLWRTGQLKLEGQGLSPLPDQKDLPEEFQKKLEQWNKKRSGFVASSRDSMKRANKHADVTRKTSGEDRVPSDKEKRTDKQKPHEKDKLEKLAKLKAIVSDHPAKEIEVKTSAGVMKFEGISRKFTRRLYEWEKSRGIGPESSTFALLHPGYCPIDVGRISKESHNNENSPTLSRSLSLDSISPNIALSAISQQASSLSLNDVNELKELDGVRGSDPLLDTEFKKYEEPEAVMVEVEDHIVETASALITAHTFVEQQTPIYKYEEVTCSDFCNSRRIQSYESYTNLAPLLSALNRVDELFDQLKLASPDIVDNEEIRHCEATVSFVRHVYPYYAEHLMNPNVLNAISDVQSELGRLTELSKKSPLDEACCQEIMQERDHEYNEELKGLHESLELLKLCIDGRIKRYAREIVPDINITPVDCNDEPLQASHDLPTKKQVTAFVPESNEASGPCVDTDVDPQSTAYRSYVSNGAAAGATAAGGIKKKLRLRKMGSRQSSKTESDSSDEDVQSALETPRRVKRKNYRLKQRSFDEDSRKSEEPANSMISEDILYALKVKPRQPTEQCESIDGVEKYGSKVFTALNEISVPLLPLAAERNILESTNIFVPTKRKIYTTIHEATADDGITVIVQDVPPEPEFNQPSYEEHQTASSVDALVAAPEQNLQPRKPVGRKSLSLTDLRELECDDERNCQSADNAKPANMKKRGDVRPPLASDSFRVINKSCSALGREGQNLPKSLGGGGLMEDTRREHRFKKNPDKSHLPPHMHGVHTQSGATVKKIETKIAKTNSGSSVEQVSPHLLTPDKTDNTLPRICRKSLTPTIKQLQFIYPTPTNSEPTTPVIELVQHKPSSPLSEHARRIQKAKEAFLQSTILRPKPSCRRRDEIVRNETWEQNRRSDQSLSSIGSEDLNLPKSFSVGAITVDNMTHSDAGTDPDMGAYDSLPRGASVSRSGKISSKLGFATLASKFRRVKGKGKKGKESAAEKSAVTTLCRQTLLADIIALPQLIAAGEKPNEREKESVMKSQSSPQASGAGSGGGRGAVGGASGAGYASRANESLNKSQSEQYVKRIKESYV